MTKTVKGLGSLKRVSELMDKLGMKHPLLVGSPMLLPKLRTQSFTLSEAVSFSGYHPNPDLYDCRMGVNLYRENKCDSLISIGGGSAIDTAKGIKAYLLAENEEAVRNSDLKPSFLPHLAIPATAGTGSEVTQFAVVYVDGSKLSLNHPLLLPEGALLDGELLESLPQYHKKSSALDALAQGIESWWAKTSTSDSKVHAFLAVSGVLSHLRKYLENDAGAAQEMLEASWQSGMAIQMTRTTAAHAMSYQLTKRFEFAHGHACMLTLPILWEELYHVEKMKPVLGSLAAAMRLNSPEDGPSLLRGILCTLELMPDIKLSEEELETLAVSVNTERLGNHPVPITRDELKSIYNKALIMGTEEERCRWKNTWNQYA